MKIRQPGASRALSSRRAISCALLELVEQPPHPLEVFGRGVVDEVRLAADDQHRTARMILAPGGKPRRDQLGGGGVDRFLALADFGAKPRLGFGKGQAGRAAH